MCSYRLLSRLELLLKHSALFCIWTKKGFVYIIHFKYKVLMCHVTTKSAEMLYSGGQELGLRLHCVL